MNSSISEKYWLGVLRLLEQIKPLGLLRVQLFGKNLLDRPIVNVHIFFYIFIWNQQVTE